MMKYTVPIGQREETFQAENVLAVVQPPMTKGTSAGLSVIPSDVRICRKSPRGNPLRRLLSMILPDPIPERRWCWSLRKN